MRRVTTLAGLLLALAAAGAGPARAAGAPDGPIATDPGAADPTAHQIAAWIAADDGAAQPLSAAPQPEGPLLPERRIHGQVGAEVSNRGYGGFAAVQMPVGRASEVDLAVAGEHADYGRWGRGDRKSLFLGVQVDGGDVARLIGREKCNVPRWGVPLKGDPVVTADGSCLKPVKTADDDPTAGPRYGGAR